MFSLITNLVFSTIVLLITAKLLPGFELENVQIAILACFIIGFLNFLIRPILVLLTLPLNIITLGLFSFIINALILNVAAGLIDGFTIEGWTASLLGAVTLGIVQVIINFITPGKRKLLG